MKQLHKILAVTLVALFAVTFPSSSFSGSKSAKMQIRVRVVAHVDYRVIHDIPSIEITARDIIKGYKDIHNGTILKVTSNSPSGYLLSVCAQELDSIASVQVTVDHDSFELPSYGCTEIYASFQGGNEDLKKFTYRMNLTPETQAGIYPLPVSVSAHSL